MQDDGVVAVLRDLPGRPCIRLANGAGPRSRLVPSDTPFSCLMSVGKLKREIVKEFTRRTLATASGDAPSAALLRGALSSAPHTGLMGSSHNALFASPLGFPVLGERFLIVQVNNQVVSDASIVGDALRDTRYALPGMLRSIAVFASEFRATVRFQWDAHGQASVHAPLGPEHAFDGVSGSTRLSELRRALVASWSRAGRRPLSDVGWGFVLVAPQGGGSSTPVVGGGSPAFASHEVVDFIVSDVLVEHWDINALRASLPLVERLDTTTGVVVVTLFLHAYRLVEIAGGWRSPHPQPDATTAPAVPSLLGPHTWRHIDPEDSEPDDFVTARVRVTTRCVSPRLVPTLVDYYSVHEVMEDGGSTPHRQRRASLPQATNANAARPHSRGTQSPRGQSSPRYIAAHVAPAATHSPPDRAVGSKLCDPGDGSPSVRAASLTSSSSDVLSSLSRHLRSLEVRATYVAPAAKGPTTGGNDGRQSTENTEQPDVCATGRHAVGRSASTVYIVGTSHPERRSLSRKTATDKR